MQMTDEQIGGSDRIVEIDECLIVSIKYNTGKELSLQVGIFEV